MSPGNDSAPQPDQPGGPTTAALNEVNTERSRYQVMPPLAEDELAALRADIEQRGVLVPVVRDQHGNLLDGHHRQQICDELGIVPPVETVTVTDEQDARSVARALNLARRHLNSEQKRQLIADELIADPDRSDRAIGRLLGVDNKTVGSVRHKLTDPAASEEIPHPGTDEVPLSTVILGHTLGWPDPEGLNKYLARQEAARQLVRTGKTPMPPDWWEPAPADDAHAQTLRLAEWDLRAQYDAGGFLNWCKKAGITGLCTGKPLKFAEQLRYPLDDLGLEQLPEGWTDEDEHIAAWVHFHMWLFTTDELEWWASTSQLNVPSPAEG